MEGEGENCRFCGRLTSSSEPENPFVIAGEWLSEDVWHDEGQLCSLCLENRGRLAMMYLHDKNR